MADNTNTTSWPELAASLYDALTGRGAEITYKFEDMEVHVPSGAGSNIVHAPWKLNGTLKITTRNVG